MEHLLTFVKNIHKNFRAKKSRNYNVDGLKFKISYTYQQLFETLSAEQKFLLNKIKTDEVQLRKLEEIELIKFIYKIKN